jgi:hypothetical protein
MTRAYVIAGPTDPLDDERLYWSNVDGWVDFDSATRFPDTVGTMPIEASGWSCADERHGVPCPQPCNVCDDECGEA